MLATLAGMRRSASVANQAMTMVKSHMPTSTMRSMLPRRHFQNATRSVGASQNDIASIVTSRNSWSASDLSRADLAQVSVKDLNKYLSMMQPFSAPAVPMQIPGSISETVESIMDPLMDESNTMHMTSVLRKRRIKMRKHKYKKLRKRTRALRKKLGK